MNKKLVISIVSIMSFILLLSGILIINNKEVKKTSEIVNTLDGVGKYIAVALVSIIGIVTTLYLRKNKLQR